MPTSKSQGSLYERPGGVYSIATVVDDFKVPKAEQGELQAIVQSTYGDIVVGKRA